MAQASVAAKNSLYRRFSAVAPGAAFAAGWLALYFPSYSEFAAGVWLRDENAHAPFVLAIVVFSAVARLAKMDLSPANAAERALGLGAIALSILMLAVGRASDAVLLESASQTPAAVGCSLFLLGARGVRELAFPLAMTAFLVIWPGWALDAVTFPLKLFVSQAVSETLFALGLPVAQSGAVISAGPYQLLVADACSGLNSMIALAAVAAVYLYAARRTDFRIAVFVGLAVVPIAVGANIARVAALVLITYFLGYDAGQSYLHEGAGLVMFSIALALIFLVDAIAVASFLREPRPA